MNSRIVSLSAALLSACLLAGPASGQERTKPAPAKPAAESVRKVVYHADFADPRRFSGMLQSINNMVSTYQGEFQDYDVRIVFVSHGIRFVTPDALAGTPFAWDEKDLKTRDEIIQRLGQLRDLQGVKFELCNITREAINLGDKKLIPGVTLVTSGVVRLAELQSQGFAYLKIE
jgi:intracellular sulfur oxidation DsrE/DsrF family protein